MNWYLYIAQAKSGFYYIGITNNPEKRIERHNSGKGSRMAIQHGTFTLKYVSKPFGSKSKARMREIQVKKWSREKKEKLINEEWQ